MVERTYKKHGKLKHLIDGMRVLLLADLEIAKDAVMHAMKALLELNQRPEAMLADKVRAKLVSIESKYKHTDPLVKIYRMEEQKQLKEKQRFKGVILMLELSCIEMAWIKNRCIDSLWTAKNATRYGGLDVTADLNDVLDKIVAFERFISSYETFVKSSVGRENIKELKEQLLEFFNEDDLRDIIRLVKAGKFDQIERELLDAEYLIVMSPPPEELLLNLGSEEEPIMPAWEPEPEPEPEAVIMDYEAEGLLFDITASAPSSMDEVPPAAGNDQDQGERGGRRLASHAEMFIRAVTGRSLHENEARAFILNKGLECQKENKNHVPFVSIYEEITRGHSDWQFTPKQLLKVIADLAKHGLIDQVETMPNGYKIVHFQPAELTGDPTAILKLARMHDVLTKEDIMVKLQWNELKTRVALDFLEKHGFAKTDTSFLGGKRYFFPGTQ